ncbi:MAG: hypothetical protein N4A57_14705 [Anaeromicrobium sp.]|jgi:hypothetical protein|uniref:hypothetical protein n=1 Tax=Anaeromicrobium sp. TaxID=1929132 RepID=UPI0025DC342E|nr:hypothetical protein [Anaeromicrobium sp.]MCT4595496.1 hypothetical protein [Anaeromicrobium sp.]
MSETNVLIPKNFEVEEASEFREILNDLMRKGEKKFYLQFSTRNVVGMFCYT